MLARLGRDFRLSIISNTVNPAMLQTNLDRMHAAHLFHQVITSTDFGWRKPHPGIFGAAVARLGVDISQVLYVGDTYEDDYQGATGAGLRCVLIDPGRRWHGVVVADRIDRVLELEKLLGKLGPAWHGSLHKS